jgi:hypothetical protein
MMKDFFKQRHRGPQFMPLIIDGVINGVYFFPKAKITPTRSQWSADFCCMHRDQNFLKALSAFKLKRDLRLGALPSFFSFDPFNIS